MTTEKIISGSHSWDSACSLSSGASVGVLESKGRGHACNTHTGHTGT